MCERARPTHSVGGEECDCDDYNDIEATEVLQSDVVTWFDVVVIATITLLPSHLKLLFLSSILSLISVPEQ